MATVDEISPLTIGEDKIALTVDPSSSLKTFKPVIVNVNYSASLIEGVELPLVLIIQPAFGSGDGYKRKVYRNKLPVAVTFTPLAAGDYLLLLKEMFHNRWQGRLVVTVEGEEFADRIRS